MSRYPRWNRSTERLQKSDKGRKISKTERGFGERESFCVQVCLENDELTPGTMPGGHGVRGRVGIFRSPVFEWLF